jgi:hypothetical protein
VAVQAKDDDVDEERTTPGAQPGRAIASREDELRSSERIAGGPEPSQGSGVGRFGFRARLAGVGLWDLVQMECLAGSRAAVRVAGEGGTGYLYFAHGNIVHAVTADQVGEPAALEILGWTTGSFQRCDRPWPEGATIATSHEALILQVAKRRDESSNLVAFPGRGAGELDDVEMQEFEEEGEADMRSPDEREVTLAPPATRAEAPGGDFSLMLRLSGRGEIIRNSGASERLAETAAYARRLIDLAGELLGVEGFSAFECTFAQGRMIAFVEENGDTIVLRPRPEANLRTLRERLGL